MSTLPFAAKLAATLVIGWALYALPLIVLCTAWAIGRGPRDAAPPILPFDDMDDEALISVDNHRRAFVLSETGHLPPRLTRTPVHSMRAAEDCQ